MKWQFRAVVVAMAVILSAAMAEASGFTGPGAGPAVKSAADVLSVHQETPCVLEGRIVGKIPNSRNQYLFEDKSGRAIVQIKNRVFGQSTVTPGHVVRIVGEVDWDGKYPNTVQAERLEIIGQVQQTNS